MDEEYIRVYENGGHIPGVPGFFPAGASVKIDERTNTVVAEESPPALPLEDEPEKQALVDNQEQPVEPVEPPIENQNQSEQGEALPVVTPILDLGMLGGNS